MTDEMIALARRAVACRGWRWLPGMKLTAGLRITESLIPFTFSVDLPDLTDPATLGCLLALVREAWDCRGIHTTRFNRGREWIVRHDLSLPRQKILSRAWGSYSEAEALVAALEAAP